MLDAMLRFDIPSNLICIGTALIGIGVGFAMTAATPAEYWVARL